jgi:hypothetical protein
MHKYQNNKVDAGAPSASGARKSVESSLSGERVHYRCALSVCSALRSTQPGRISQAGD